MELYYIDMICLWVYIVIFIVIGYTSLKLAEIIITIIKVTVDRIIDRILELNTGMKQYLYKIPNETKNTDIIEEKIIPENNVD
jgi:hypothetical protein